MMERGKTSTRDVPALCFLGTVNWIVLVHQSDGLTLGRKFHVHGTATVIAWFGRGLLLLCYIVAGVCILLRSHSTIPVLDTISTNKLESCPIGGIATVSVPFGVLKTIGILQGLND